VNFTTITKRIEALEERQEAKTPNQMWVRRVWQDGNQIDGYTGPIEGMNIIDVIIVSPPKRDQID
jgi:hypothetical protein